MESRQNSSDAAFTGPLFVVGMPRSGTKLLRGLLNQHSMIGIPDIESQFLPFWSRHWHEYGDLSVKENFTKFYEHAISLPYFVYMKETVGIIGESEWYEQCQSYDIPGVFEALIRHDANIPKSSKGIWGDKTPSYIIHIPLLKSLFPSAKIIHIVRDVRDYSLSSHKAWGKNMVRAAVRWQERITMFRTNLRLYTNDIWELKYENLLENPEKELRNICDFLAIPFQEKMVELDRPSENLGDAKGQQKVVKGNKRKYVSSMKTSLIAQIERISKPALQAYDYPVDYTGPRKEVSALRMTAYQLLDGINLVRFEARERGVINALKFRWSLFKTSGNRT